MRFFFMKDLLLSILDSRFSILPFYE